MHRGAQPVTTDCRFVFLGKHAGANNGTAAAAAAAAVVATAAAAAQQQQHRQQVHQQGMPKHIHEYTLRHQAG